MNLYFLKTKSEDLVYSQNQPEFIENLSIIDIMMFNDTDRIRDFLELYELDF